MRLRKIRVENFQSFSDSGDINFADGFNLIIGQNNSGKSALLRAMLPALPDDRHRTPDCWETFKLPAPNIDLLIEASGIEIRDWCLRSQGVCHIPITENEFQNVLSVMNEFFELDRIAVSVSRTPNSGFGSGKTYRKYVDEIRREETYSTHNAS